MPPVAWKQLNFIGLENWDLRLKRWHASVSSRPAIWGFSPHAKLDRMAARHRLRGEAEYGQQY
jgi:hypothetical protein